MEVENGWAATSSEAFWAVWMRHRDYLFGRCLKWLGGNRHDAEDVMSKGAVSAALYVRSNPQGVQSFRPWILRILYHLCIDELRARGGVVQDPTASERASTASDWARSPDRVVLRREIVRSIEQAAGDLPAHLRQIFVLRFVEEQPYEAIAQVMGISPENARKRLQLARGLMRAALRPLGGESTNSRRSSPARRG